MCDTFFHYRNLSIAKRDARSSARDYPGQTFCVERERKRRGGAVQYIVANKSMVGHNIVFEVTSEEVTA